jgi:NAD(P)-dependent dehydrogenase (short-subunit alcohol dehydrogenase family)
MFALWGTIAPMDQRTAIVTGGNRGIGLEVCRQLAGLGYLVVLTSRDESRGRTAVAKLKNTNLVYHPLDVTRQDSVNVLRDFVAREFGRCDVLVNNAAIYIDGSRNVLNVKMDTVRETFETNVIGAWMMCQAFAPMMVKQNCGRVVNVSSQSGQLSSMGSSTPAYNASKAALNAITVMVASAMRGKNVLVNSVCPGWVKTDMGGPGAPRSVEQGADTIVWLATLPDGGPTGGFFHDRERIEW